VLILALAPRVLLRWLIMSIDHSFEDGDQPQLSVRDLLDRLTAKGWIRPKPDHRTASNHRPLEGGGRRATDVHRPVTESPAQSDN
jgi:hypothetical protein